MDYCKLQKEGHDAYCNKEAGHTDRHWYRSGYWFTTQESETK